MSRRATCRKRRRGATTASTTPGTPRRSEGMINSPTALADARRQRLLAAMAAEGFDEIVVYGNAWQGDYLRYVSDFGILEGHGIAVIAADGVTELFLDSVTDAERAEVEVPGVAVRVVG